MLQYPQNRADHIGDRDPGHPLPAIARFSAKAQSERQQHLFQRPAVFAESGAETHMHRSDSGSGCRLRRRFPLAAQLGRKLLSR